VLLKSSFNDAKLNLIVEPIAKVKTEADEGNYEIQTSRKADMSRRSLLVKAEGIPSAVCRGLCGKV
jgi:hypothetical protein